MPILADSEMHTMLIHAAHSHQLGKWDNSHTTN